MEVAAPMNGLNITLLYPFEPNAAGITFTFIYSIRIRAEAFISFYERNRTPIYGVD